MIVIIVSGNVYIISYFGNFKYEIDVKVVVEVVVKY